MKSSGKKVAILSATSHIAKGMIYGFHQRKGYKLALFARSSDRVREFLKAIDCQDHAAVMHFDSFPDGHYDVVINCVGIGDPGKLRGAESSIFRITETFDNLTLDYLETHPAAFYINLSSGAVYGTNFAVPVGASTQSLIEVNNIAPPDYYGIAKLHAEAKHRALPKRNIVDLRVFSYFSRFMDVQSKFLLNEILSCIKHGKTFETGPDDIIRDYVHREDLLRLIEACIAQGALNDFFDVYSLNTVSKFEMLDFFSQRYGLKYQVKEHEQGISPTGSKKHYYSNSKKAGLIGYSPQYTSLDCIAEASQALLR